MIKIYNANDINIDDIVKIAECDNTEVDKIVDSILVNVRENGDKALYQLAEELDGVKLSSLMVTEDEINAAYKLADPMFIDILEQARDNIIAFHTMQLRDDYEITPRNGVILGQKYLPVASCGLYIPGGTASYPSSVLMNSVPAKLAGVKKIVMVTPPQKDGTLSNDILVACKIAGITEIYKLGGAGAIGALAYGTETVPKVDVIVGPGNVYVARAKMKVYGLVGIDMIAGPSEILIIADESANAEYVAADMLSQAEHDKLASSILVTTSLTLANKVSLAIENQITELQRHDIARVAIDNHSKIIIAKTIDDCISISNSLAPEHLEICLDEPFNYLDKITNAGSIFLGKNVPEAVGDYFAGTNHTLPTSGTARFSSALSVDNFIKKSQYIYYSDDALTKDSENIIEFAMKEGLQAHAKSVSIRCRN